jgi:DNA-binding response OmpR family regulator
MREVFVKRVLLLGNNVELSRILLEHLAQADFYVETADSDEMGEQKACERPYAVIVLDVILPRNNGLDVLHNLRTRTETPIVMLTAVGDAIERILGLEMGADACLPKPFNPRELVALIWAILRRMGRDQEDRTQNQIPKILTIGDIKMHISTRTVYLAGTIVNLTSIEFNVLELLLSSAGKIVSREELTQSVLGRSISPFDRSIDVHISNIRKKLGHETASLERIKSIRGVGYLYALTATSDAYDAAYSVSTGRHEG